LKPFNHVGVLSHELVFLSNFDILKLLFKFDQILRVICFDCHFLLNLLDLGRNLWSQLKIDIVVNLVQKSLHDVLTFIAQLIVYVTALDQKHVHSDLEWHLISDLKNRLLKLIDFSLEVFSVESLLLEVLFDSLFLFQNEKEIIIDINCKFDCLQVFLKGF
jgi:hypothetical protein